MYYKHSKDKEILPVNSITEYPKKGNPLLPLKLQTRFIEEFLQIIVQIVSLNQYKTNFKN
jgi:hypothetical protein